MKIAALTQGLHVPSARFRIRQLINPLHEYHLEVTELIADPQSYPPAKFSSRVRWAASVIVDSMSRAIKSQSFDASILQRELISTVPSFEFLAKRPLILDVDDAIWLHRGGLAARNAVRFADHVVAGNAHIAEYFSGFGTPTTIIPTAVDVNRFRPSCKLREESKGIIGWCGTAGGYKFFTRELQVAIGKALSSHPGWKFQIVSNAPPDFPEIPSEKMQFIRWSPENEAELSSGFDIGLMPIFDDPWSRGKCSYKMLLYMACGIPVVVSNIGMNADLLREGHIGFGPGTADDWSAALDFLIDNPMARHQMGKAGRALVEKKYSIQVATQRWNEVLKKIVVS
ncbi:glycosyltransferase family 4 protein [Leptothrix discophora]|uniref:Glycosyltransferase family 4 protein n=1 Tax=Leptothrix discophora TaxID=89 RepID=A0ABT9G045_LEPDI|nr:glycosyltransferase family 4 protein [Leptothrix discophora]MDP4299851.1 glycosyltransferase family 4 protein [Leptothrix discophora]